MMQRKRLYSADQSLLYLPSLITYNCIKLIRYWREHLLISVIIPAYNEASVIRDCLNSILAQTYSGRVQIIVAANGCTDGTAEIASCFSQQFATKDYQFSVLEIAKRNKNNAMNVADELAVFDQRLYLDADVTSDADFLEKIIQALDTPEPRYASGELNINYGKSFVSKAYGEIWSQTPYIRDTVHGCGCYAVNARGRQFWLTFPSIHSDDKFVRLQFNAKQRFQVSSSYLWPLPQGFLNLIKVRRRWILGNRELATQYPELKVNDSKRFEFDRRFFKILVCSPVSTLLFFFIYGIVAARVYAGPRTAEIKWNKAR